MGEYAHTLFFSFPTILLFAPFSELCFGKAGENRFLTTQNKNAIVIHLRRRNSLPGGKLPSVYLSITVYYHALAHWCDMCGGAIAIACDDGCPLCV